MIPFNRRISTSHGSSSRSSSIDSHSSGEEKSPRSATRQSAAAPRPQNTEHSLNDLLNQDIRGATEAFSAITKRVSDAKEGANKALIAWNKIKDDDELTVQNKMDDYDLSYKNLRVLFCDIDGLLDECHSIYKNNNSATAHLEQQKREKHELINDMGNFIRSPHYTENNSAFKVNFENRREQLFRDKDELLGEQVQCRQKMWVELEAKDPTEELRGWRHSISNALGEINYYVSNLKRVIQKKNRETLAAESAVYDNLKDLFAYQMAQANYAYTQPPPTPSGCTGRIVAALCPGIAKQGHQEFIGGIQRDIGDRLTDIEALQRKNWHVQRNIPDHALIFPDKVSRYGQVHTISFEYRGVLESSFTAEEAYTRRYLEQRSVEGIQEHRERIESLDPEAINPSLKASLNAIPVGEAAAIAEVKPTKIILNLHGNEDHLVASRSSPSTKSREIPAEKVGTYLTNHLTPGDYKGKLTIALRTCNSAYKNESSGSDDRSSIERIGDILKNKEYTGIKLTGAIGITMVVGKSTMNGVSMGTTMVAEPIGSNSFVKLSKSDHKVAISI